MRDVDPVQFHPGKGDVRFRYSRIVQQAGDEFSSSRGDFCCWSAKEFMQSKPILSSSDTSDPVFALTQTVKNDLHQGLELVAGSHHISMPKIHAWNSCLSDGMIIHPKSSFRHVGIYNSDDVAGFHFRFDTGKQMRSRDSGFLDRSFDQIRRCLEQPFEFLPSSSRRLKYADGEAIGIFRPLPIDPIVESRLGNSDKMAHQVSGTGYSSWNPA